MWTAMKKALQPAIIAVKDKDKVIFFSINYSRNIVSGYKNIRQCQSALIII
jgi:hypothetical protein